MVTEAKLNEEEIEGEITNIVYQSSEDGFCIIKITNPNVKLATLTGHCSHPKIGQTISAKGQWIETSQYGRQFKTDLILVQPPKSKSALIHYLASGAIRGIGKHLAQQLVGHFGTEILEILNTNPKALLALPGIGKKKLNTIAKSWENQQGFANVSMFLQNHGVGPARAVHIFKKYGADTIAMVSENPYRLYREIIGIGFHIADKMAQSLGLSADHPQRILNGIIFVMQEATSHGHTAITEERMLEEAAKLLKIEIDLIKNQLPQIVSDEQLVALNQNHTDLLALRHVHIAETMIAKKLLTLCQAHSHLPARQKIAPQLQGLGKTLGYQLSSSQNQALNTIFSNKVCIMTGGPGVGKTTLIQSVVHILQKNFCTFLLCAPTGRAAKRLKESTGHTAKTIHRALGVDPVSKKFQNNEKNPINVEYCIVDEASMLDTLLTRDLLAALPKHCGLLLVGDVDQLPSVGPGNVLNDLIKTNRIPVVELTEIFRQARTSEIVQYSHTVRKGHLPAFHSNQAEEQLDCYVIFSSDTHDIINKVNQLVLDRIPKKFAVDPMKDIQVLCPMQKGPLGTQKINQVLQSTLNKNKIVINNFSNSYKIGDRVMQIKNNYDKDVFNGDIGYIHKNHEEKQLVTIMFDDKPVEYYYDELDEISLAYAMTIHKSQGSEFKVVIMPFFSGHYIMLERNLIYTGMTRARALLILIGDKKSLALGVHKQTAKDRLTLLDMKLDSIMTKSNTEQ